MAYQKPFPFHYESFHFSTCLLRLCQTQVMVADSLIQAVNKDPLFVLIQVIIFNSNHRTQGFQTQEVHHRKINMCS